MSNFNWHIQNQIKKDLKIFSFCSKMFRNGQKDQKSNLFWDFQWIFVIFDLLIDIFNILLAFFNLKCLKSIENFRYQSKIYQKWSKKIKNWSILIAFWHHPFFHVLFSAHHYLPPGGTLPYKGALSSWPIFQPTPMFHCRLNL